MALTIYMYKKHKVHRGFVLTISFTIDDDGDTETLRQIIENDFASSCVGTDIDFPKLNKKTHLNTFIGSYEQGRLPMVECSIDQLSLKIEMP